MSLPHNPFGLVGNDTLLHSVLSDGRARRLGHAYVLAGPEGSGRHLLAQTLAAAALCASEELPRPCGVCRSCKKVSALLHPDAAVIGAPDAGAVTVDTVRSLRRDIYVAPVEGARKIYIVEQADTMTVQAQNALLKVLEEPPSYGMILLLCQAAEALLPTLLSRSVVLRLSPAEPAEGARVLMRRMPKLQPAAALEAIQKAGGFIGAALYSLSEGEDGRLIELGGQFDERLFGKSEAVFLALHSKLSQNRRLLCDFSGFMYRRLLCATRQKAAGGGLDEHPLYDALALDKTFALMELFRDTRDRTERNGNASLCAFYLLVTSWEVTH